ncbi:MAG: DNA-3-methyladenine glycosylase I [Candidatus Thorarchaeota archaeon]
MVKKCEWANFNLEMEEYHDKEWGIPEHDDHKIFELLTLEGMQAGLSWNTILKKRTNFRKAFDNFDYKKIAKYSEKKVEELVQNEGIIRNKLKIQAVITNANAFLKVINQFGTFDKYIWNFVKNKPIINQWKTLNEIPSKTESSELISKDLKKRGFKFVGSTIIYAFLQAIGIINDHLIYCVYNPNKVNNT